MPAGRSRSTKLVLAKNAGWNYAGFLFETGVGILLVAYIARHVPVSHYGLFLLASSIAALLLLLDFGIPAVLVPSYVGEEVRGGPEAVGRLLKASTTALAAAGFVGLAICILLTRILPGPFRIASDLVSVAVPVFVFVGLTVQLALPARALETLYTAYQRFDLLNGMQMLLASLRAALTVWFIAHGAGVIGLAAAQLAVTALRFALLGLLLKRATGVSPSIRAETRGVLPPLLRNGRWALLDILSRQVSLGADPIILGMFASMGSVAIYGVGGRLPFQLANLVRKGAVVTMPDLATGHATGDLENVRRTFATTLRTVLAVLLPVVFLLMFLADDIIALWVGPAYRSSVPVLRWLLIVTVVQGLAIPADLVLYARGRFATAARITSIESVCKLVLAVALVRRYGGAGLAAATAVTNALATTLWFLPAACRAADLSATGLALTLFKDASLPAGVMAFLLLGIRFIGGKPVESLVAGVAALLLYGVIWFFVTGRHLLRSGRLVVDAPGPGSN